MERELHLLNNALISTQEMKFKSTRGGSEVLTFEEAVLRGYAPDGGMIVPATIPCIERGTLRQWAARNLTFPQLCEEIFALFIDEEEMPRADLRALLQSCFGEFTDDEIVPIKHLAPRHATEAGSGFEFDVAELFHGPTLAFKDLGLQFIGHMFEYLVRKRQRKLSIIVATSGDTGSAAIHCVKGRQNMNIFVLLPGQGRIAELQERQMTTVLDKNVFSIAVDGTSDDADVAVKGVFADPEFVEKYGVCTINSPNWARIMMQLVHFFYAYLRVCPECDREIVFSIPSGGFGNGFSGYLTKRMGLPVKYFIPAVNDNDTLHRFFAHGELAPSDVVVKTISPAMDINVPYNIERLLYYLSGENAEKVREWMTHLEQSPNGKVKFDEELMAKARALYRSASATQQEVKAGIEFSHRIYDYVFCPHTAIAFLAAQKAHQQGEEAPIVVAATAHPAKFVDTVEEVLRKVNADYSLPVPPQLAGIRERETRCLQWARPADWADVWTRDLQSLVTLSYQSG